MDPTSCFFNSSNHAFYFPKMFIVGTMLRVICSCKSLFSNDANSPPISISFTLKLRYQYIFFICCMLFSKISFLPFGICSTVEKKNLDFVLKKRIPLTNMTSLLNFTSLCCSSIDKGIFKLLLRTFIDLVRVV